MILEVSTNLNYLKETYGCSICICNFSLNNTVFVVMPNEKLVANKKVTTWYEEIYGILSFGGYQENNPCICHFCVHTILLAEHVKNS